MRNKVVGIVLCVAMLVFCYPVGGQIMPKTFEIDQSKRVEKKIKTTYDKYGRPVNQGQVRKGQHRVTGSTNLSGGQAKITVNTSTVQGRQVVGFLSAMTYSGVALSLDTTNTNRYWIVPLTPNTFMVKSSDSTDNGTVQWKVEGE